MKSSTEVAQSGVQDMSGQDGGTEVGLSLFARPNHSGDVFPRLNLPIWFRQI